MIVRSIVLMYYDRAGHPIKQDWIIVGMTAIIPDGAVQVHALGTVEEDA